MSSINKHLNYLIVSIAALEGKKKQIDAGNLREVLAVIKKLCHKDLKFICSLNEYIMHRMPKKMQKELEN